MELDGELTLIGQHGRLLARVERARRLVHGRAQAVGVVYHLLLIVVVGMMMSFERAVVVGRIELVDALGSVHRVWQLIERRGRRADGGRRHRRRVRIDGLDRLGGEGQLVEYVLGRVRYEAALHQAVQAVVALVLAQLRRRQLQQNIIFAIC